MRAGARANGQPRHEGTSACEQRAVTRIRHAGMPRPTRHARTRQRKAQEGMLTARSMRACNKCRLRSGRSKMTSSLASQ